MPTRPRVGGRDRLADRGLINRHDVYKTRCYDGALGRCSFRLTVSRGRLIPIFVFSLVALNIQCPAFCAAESCGSMTSTQPGANLPPCHRHRSNPARQDTAACRHGLLPGVLQTVDARVDVKTDTGVFASLAANPSMVLQPVRDANRSARSASPPPGFPPDSIVVLRI